MAITKYVTVEQVTSVMNALAQKIATKDYEQKANLGDLAYVDEIGESQLSSALLTEINGKADSDNINELIASKLGATYRPAGSITEEELLAITPSNSNLGSVWNVSETFTTTADWVEEAGKKYPAGTNVVCVEIPGDNEGDPKTYKFDVLAGFIDQDALASASDLQDLLDQIEGWETASQSDIQAIINGIDLESPGSVQPIQNGDNLGY